MDVEKLIDILEYQDSIQYTLVTTDHVVIYNNMNIVAATIFGDTLEIRGDAENSIEIPIAAIQKVTYIDENDPIIVHTDCIDLRISNPKSWG